MLTFVLASLTVAAALAAARVGGKFVAARWRRRPYRGDGPTIY